MGEVDDKLDVISVEQDKPVQELVASVNPVDKKQKAASICFDFINREIILNVIEGEDMGNGFIPVRSRQRSLKTKTDATPVITAIANKAAKDILTALANITLQEGIK